MDQMFVFLFFFYTYWVNATAHREPDILAIRCSRLLENDILFPQIYFGQKFLFHFSTTIRDISDSYSLVAC